MSSEKHISANTQAVDPVVSTEPQASEETPSQNLLRRIGYITAALIVLSFLVAFSAIGFLAFLWYSNWENDTWHSIVMANWMPRSISLTSTALRWAISTQAALGLAMIAAVTLESFDVPLVTIADISLMRASSGGSLLATLKNVCWPLFRFGAPGILVRTVIPILLLLSTMTLIQFSSTVLLSDLRTDVIPGSPLSTNLTIDWFFNGQKYNWTAPPRQNSYWSSGKPPFWPAFGEISEPPIVQDGVSDTGKNLRAFLPYLTADTRQSIRQYDGKAVLVDTRVTCQRPILEDLVVYTTDPNGKFGAVPQPALHGSASPSFTNTPRFNASDIPTIFDCPFSEKSPHVFSICELKNTQSRYPEWEHNIDKHYPGTIVSEFREWPITSLKQNSSGAAYLILTISNDILPPGNGEWVEWEITTADASGNGTYTHRGNATLCYSALDTVIRDVSLYSSTNRTEPSLSWSPAIQNFNWTDVYRQIRPGSISNKTAEERGVLNMQIIDTLATPENNTAGTDGPIGALTSGSIYQSVWPYLNEAVHMLGGGADGYPNFGYGNFSAILDSNFWGWSTQYASFRTEIGAPLWIINLFEHIVYGEDTVATALQTVLFSIAGIAYYDQLPQYDSWQVINTTSFVPGFHPGGPHGSTRTEVPVGFTITILVVAFHTVVFLFVCWLFATKSKYSRLGDTWLAIANVVEGALTGGMLEAARKPHGYRYEPGAATGSGPGEDDAYRSTRVGLAVVDGKLHLQRAQPGFSNA
ncbi:Mitochondrial outer membrane protein iml2 [Orbilia ellipsospora]|uniref:Mitochondrial outer membrane protein iml2 n=1 Tax=Orbilia ellipsospora TaxID=2528407 RepID=A0AAV9XHC0_9PEZI